MEELNEDSFDIFISYRRNGGEWFAYCIYLELINMGYSVFFDKESLKGGRFEKKLVEQINKCKDFVLILPPNALDRCIEQEDLVYQEIVTAQNKKKNIIPIFLNKFIIPNKEVFYDSGMGVRYKQLFIGEDAIDKENGIEANGIMDLDKVLVQLQRKLLESIPDVNNIKRISVLTLETLFKGILKSNDESEKQCNLVKNISYPEFFVQGSRDREIAWLSDAINRMQPVYIWGEAGIGKTELAYEFARYQGITYNTYFTTFKGSLRRTIIEMPFIGYEMPNLEQLTKVDRVQIEEHIYIKKLDLLRGFSNNNILIIDNFDSDNKSLSELKQEEAYRDIIGLDLHIVFTTRKKPDKSTPEILPLKEEELLKVMRYYTKKQKISNDKMIHLIKLVGHHTMTVELIAKLIGDEFEPVNPDEIIQVLQSYQIDKLPTYLIESSKDRQYFEKDIYEHLKILYKLDKLDDAQRRILFRAFFIPEEGMDFKLFVASLLKRIGGIEQISYLNAQFGEIDNRYKENIDKEFMQKEKTIYAKLYNEKSKKVKNIVDKGWLRIANQKLYIHPLIKEILGPQVLHDKGGIMKMLFDFMDDTRLNVEQSFYSCRDRKEIQHIISYCKTIECQKAWYLLDIYELYKEDAVIFIVDASACFDKGGNREQCILYSHKALDILLKKQKFNNMDYIARMHLDELWCPNLNESLWGDEIFYGNELDDDHIHEPEKIQNLYQKLKRLHSIMV